MKFNIPLGIVTGIVVGWATLALGGHTDGSGRLGLALGVSVFVLVSVGWGRGRRGWLSGLAGAAAVASVMLAHFLSRVGRLP